MKSSNYIYIIFQILLIIAIVALNYFVDPYYILKKNSPLHINRYLLDEPYIPIRMQEKFQKNRQYKYVLIGGSTINAANLYNFNKELADISCFKIKTDDMAKLLFNYLDLHPETEKVFIPIDYRQATDTVEHKIPKFDKNLSAKDWSRLLFSIQTTQYSIKKLKTRIPQYPIRMVKYKVHDINITPKETKKTIEETYNLIFEELKKRNIEAVCFLPPIHANRMIYLYDKIGYQTLLDIKEYIISKNGYLIDMSTLNKFTSKPLKDSFYLFSDLIHPTNIYGYYIYNILFDNPKKDKDLYTILTKDNVKEEMQKEKEKVENWYRNNKQEYKYYIKGEHKNKKSKLTKTLNDVPAEFKNVLNYKKSIFFKN